jgi:hypothetical protein
MKCTYVFEDGGKGAIIENAATTAHHNIVKEVDAY